RHEYECSCGSFVFIRVHSGALNLNQTQGIDSCTGRYFAVREHGDVFERGLQQLAQEVAGVRGGDGDYRAVHVLKALGEALEDFANFLGREIDLAYVLAMLDRGFDGLLDRSIEEESRQVSLRSEIRRE